jgi:KaiC/GvpD/RAD55 family RecA-like ATPase
MTIEKLKTGIEGFDLIVNRDEPGVFVTFEEHPDDIRSNIEVWEEEGILKVICHYPKVDSLSALERIATAKGFREFVIGLTSFIKNQEIVGLFTATTSTLTDSIILLRYVEMYGEMRRGLTVLKMRGSMHDKDIREFTINNGGMHIGKPFRNVIGILAGNPRHIAQEEEDRLSTLFKEV